MLILDLPLHVGQAEAHAGDQEPEHAHLPQHVLRQEQGHRHPCPVHGHAAAERGRGNQEVRKRHHRRPQLLQVHPHAQQVRLNETQLKGISHILHF